MSVRVSEDDGASEVVMLSRTTRSFIARNVFIYIKKMMIIFLKTEILF